jgi:predicted nucleotidyltransferase component of viral defense system
MQDAVAEGLTSLPEGVLEKDYIVTSALHTIAHLSDDNLTLTFCGGTCLSKAYGLLDRMSEDIDFKIAFTPNAPTSKNAQSKLLSGFKKRLTEALIDTGFHLQEPVTARNGNRYLSARFLYHSQFEVVSSLRSEILIEVTANAPLAPTQQQPIQSLLTGLLNRPMEPAQVLPCITIGEALAEKVLSMLRRTAQAFAGESREPYDKMLIRHIYDAHRIVTRQPEATRLAAEIFSALVRRDVEQFGEQHPAFAISPKNTMLHTLTCIQTEAEFKGYYQQFVEGLVFDRHKTSFASALDSFSQEAMSLIRVVADDNVGSF